MMTQPESKTIHLYGGHRGGEENILRLTSQIQPNANPEALNLLVVDPQPSRAQELADFSTSRGLPAKAEQDFAERYFGVYADVRVAAMDDINATFALIASPTQEELLQFGIIASTGFLPYGGRVIGIGGTLPSGNLPIRADARYFVETLVNLSSGGRTTSWAMLSQPLNSFQIEPTRQIVHSQLAEDAWCYLNGNMPAGRLFVVETMLPSPNVYPMIVTEPTSDKIRELEREAINIAEQKSYPTESLAVAFVKPSKTWLYLTFLKQARRWRMRFGGIELPVPATRIASYNEALQPKAVLFTD